MESKKLILNPEELTFENILENNYTLEDINETVKIQETANTNIINELEALLFL